MIVETGGDICSVSTLSEVVESQDEELGDAAAAKDDYDAGMQDMDWSDLLDSLEGHGTEVDPATDIYVVETHEVCAFRQLLVLR